MSFVIRPRDKHFRPLCDLAAADVFQVLIGICIQVLGRRKFLEVFWKEYLEEPGYTCISTAGVHQVLF